ncbi:MAG: aspartate/glutamate racemase family protein [Gammaproteobacteria bacterium]|nr:MAG: aspartate/glutamate racemase family protein [Gammaproteobacteria bacterium]
MIAAAQKTIRSHRWAARFDDGRHWRARIGFVLIATERNIEHEMVRLAPAGVGMHFSRVTMEGAVSVEHLGAQLEDMAAAVRLILPGEHPDVVCYACTSGSVVMGEDRVIAELARGAPGSHTTTLVTAVIEGLRAVKARRIVIGTPYLDEINIIEKHYLEARGFEVLDIQGLNLTYDREMVRVTPDYLLEFAKAIDRPDADAIFISCGALRTVDVIQAIEDAVGKPAICSNQAMLWHCLRLAGIDDHISGFGRLMSR